jgi:ankyrin repeat protein
MRRKKIFKSTWLIASCILFLFLAGTAYGQETLELHKAIKKGNLELAKKLITEKKGINTENKSGVTPLMLAAGIGQQEIVSALLNAGADINARDENGWRPLMYAAFQGHIDIVKSLMDKDAKLDPTKKEVLLKRVKKMYTPLMCASAGGHLDIAKLLIEKGANLKIKDVEKWTALMYALRHGHLEIAKLLIENGADVQGKITNNFTTLTVAVMGGNINIVKMLIEKGVDINKKSKELLGIETALCVAFKTDHDNIAALLLEKGAKHKDCSFYPSSGDCYYARGKIQLYNAKKSESSGDKEKALKHYSKGKKHFEIALPKLKKSLEKFEEGKKLRNILSYCTSIADPVRLKKGIREVIEDAEGYTPYYEQKKNEYAKKIKKIDEYLIKCDENIKRLQ